MHRFSYADNLVDSQDDAKERERIALDHSVELFEKAKAKGVRSREAVEAVFFAQRLWSLLIEDLASEENDLSKELKSQLISIGIWVLKECERLRSDEAEGFDDIIAVTQAIRDGSK